MDNKLYLILDTKRMKFWKVNNHGYTEDINNARLFERNEALDIINAPNVNDLRLVECLEIDGEE